jgi:phosphatidylglycerophosphatase A
MRPQKMTPAWLVATWFGAGFFPKAPGTAGSIAAIPLYLLAVRWGVVGVSVAACAVTAIGTWAASSVARDLRIKDPQVVVVDEVAGMLITLLPVSEPSWRGIAAGLVIFRILDMAKPWPIRLLEKLPSGFGIMLDDIAAGVLGAMAMVGLRSAHVWS